MNLAEQLEIIPETWKHANTYLLKVGCGVVIDPGAQRDEHRQDAYAIVLATHGHYDHLAGIDSWTAEARVQFILPEDDLSMMEDTEANASQFFANRRTFPNPDRMMREGEQAMLSEDYRLRCYHTPGHTKGSSCFLLQERGQNNTWTPVALFTGDTLFADSIGRSDFPGGDPREMTESVKRLKSILMELPEELPIFPGHGSPATAKQILERNPYMRRA